MVSKPVHEGVCVNCNNNTHPKSYPPPQIISDVPPTTDRNVEMTVYLVYEVFTSKN